MGAHIVFAQQAVALERHGDDRVVRLLDGTELHARAVLIATGIRWRRLGVPQLEALVGAGVFYGAAVSESRAMQDQNVFIVGAGNSAGQAALHLAKHASAVTLLVRGDSLTKSMSSYLIRAIESTPNIAVRLRTEVVGGGGRDRLEHLELADRATGTVDEVPTAALFIMIGGEPHTQWLPREIARDGQGYLITGRDLLQQPGAHWSDPREPLPTGNEHARRLRRRRRPARLDQARRLRRGRRRDRRSPRARVPRTPTHCGHTPQPRHTRRRGTSRTPSQPNGAERHARTHSNSAQHGRHHVRRSCIAITSRFAAAPAINPLRAGSATSRPTAAWKWIRAVQSPCRANPGGKLHAEMLAVDTEHGSRAHSRGCWE